jgi:CRISPR/Cas system CSM-associated protein Csm5 (group 7 of RAMP superfamily)
VDLIHPEDCEWAVRFCQEVSARHEDYEFEYRMLAADGRIVWLHDVVSVMSIDGSPKMLRGFMFDITRRKLLEEELRKHREQLEQIVKERTVELMKANESLKCEITERKRVEEELSENVEQLSRKNYRDSIALYIVDSRKQDSSAPLELSPFLKDMEGEDFCRSCCIGFSSNYP